MAEQQSARYTSRAHSAAMAAETEAVEVAMAAALAVRKLPPAPSDASDTLWPTSSWRSLECGTGADGSAAAAASTCTWWHTRLMSQDTTMLQMCSSLT